MRAAQYCAPGNIQIRTVPEPPPPAAGMVLLRVLAASVCGTDIAEFLCPQMLPLQHRHSKSGHLGVTTLGHEFVGYIEAVGRHVDLRVGQIVVPGAGYWCGLCPACVQQRPNICEDYFVYGLHANGGFADYVCVPASMCIPVPSSCDLYAAVMAQPCAVGLHAVRRSGLRQGNECVVFGAGGFGSFVIAAAHALGASVYVVDMSEQRLDMARRLGAQVLINSSHIDVVAYVRQITADRGVDVSIETTGVSPLPLTALAVTKKGGRLHLLGIQKQPLAFDFATLVLNEIDISTSSGHVCSVDLPEALELLATTDLAQTIIGPVISLEQIPEAIQAQAEHRIVGKIIVDLCNV